MNAVSIARTNLPDTTLTGPSSAQGMGEPTQGKHAAKEQDAVHVSQQFEAILMRQFLSESMKPLLERGPSGQVYGYLITDSLAQTMSEGGGMGLAHILQAQLTK